MAPFESDPQVSGKIAPRHRERDAYVYVRQSSPRQILVHAESARRQYQLVDWACAAGWPKERVVVIDEDQGKSGALPDSRSGFGRLVAAIGRSEVGIVIALEVTRLARNCPDWHHLVYLCRWTDTLIADEHTVYDPALSADRMVLGIRGQVSELELDNAIHRMVEARWNKARRGEFLVLPPAGYDLDDLNQMVMSSDEVVVHAFRTVFAKFDELGSACQVWCWWREERLKFPVRRQELRSHPVVWTDPTYRMVLSTLHNPIYAGAYVFGRTQTVRELDPADPHRLRKRRSPRAEWPVLIQDHHEGYITFAKFLEIQQRVRGNAMMLNLGGEREGSPAREGRALLQGLVRCGVCGRAMWVSYGGHRSRRGHRTMQYRCFRKGREEGGKDCQVVGGQRIDECVVEEFLEATRPAGVEAARLSDQQMQERRAELSRYWNLQIEKAEYEAGRAERQFQAVEPENRIVARELERRWNARLTALEEMRAQAEQARGEVRPLSKPELEEARQLGAHIELIWNAETTVARDRKRLLRCAIDEVQLKTEEKRHVITIVWKGGTVTTREVARRPPGPVNATDEETVELVRQLALQFDDLQIARILNRQGRVSGLGNAFTKAIVVSMRGRHKIPACAKLPARDPHEGPFTADEAAAELGVSMGTIHRWLREGVLAGTQATRGAPWRIVLTDAVRQRVAGGEAPRGWVGLSEASRQLGLSKQRIAYLLKTGKLKAIRTTIGKRRCWRIDVLSAESYRQPGLFDLDGAEIPADSKGRQE
ncbi:MAG: recombinase family protein [Planctomycetota bacterium]